MLFNNEYKYTMHNTEISGTQFYMGLASSATLLLIVFCLLYKVYNLQAARIAREDIEKEPLVMHSNFI